MCRFMNEILQSLKSALESSLSEGKAIIALSENELVNSSENDVIRLTPVSSSKGKSYPGYDVCIYEIQASVEVFTRNRENASARISEVVCNVTNSLDTHTFNFEGSGFIALKDIRCKVVNYPNKENSVKNIRKSKVEIVVETFEEQEVS